ncbi:MAG: hypothetical protein U0360_02445 [Dehalococcoidia bacterium]
MTGTQATGTEEAHSHAPAPRAPSSRAFARHYLEMVLAMAAGMVPFGVLFISPLDPLGYRALLGAHVEVRELLMLVAMAVPMAAFMAYRGHPTGRTIEMTAGMAIPSLLVIAVNEASAVPGLTDANLTVWSHIAMLLGMLAAMLYRRREYSVPHDHAAIHGHVARPS